MTDGYDEWSVGEWHYCGSWSDEDVAREKADNLVETGTSVRMLSDDLDPEEPVVEKVIEYGVPVYRGPAWCEAEQEMLPLSFSKSKSKNTSPITQSPDSSPSKSRHATFDFNTEDWFKFSSWV